MGGGTVAGGTFLAVLGVVVVCQVLRGHALTRLKLVDS